MKQMSEILLDEEGKLKSWSKPSTGKFGLYIFRAEGEIIRIGETSSGCDRISKGFKQPLRAVLRGRERKNYLAYSWRREYANSSVFVDFFELERDPFADNYARRALEAEVTFQVRIHYGRWPKRMSEIHFQEEWRNAPAIVKRGSQIVEVYGFHYRNNF